MTHIQSIIGYNDRYNKITSRLRLQDLKDFKRFERLENSLVKKYSKIRRNVTKDQLKVIRHTFLFSNDYDSDKFQNRRLNILL